MPIQGQIPIEFYLQTVGGGQKKLVASATGSIQGAQKLTSQQAQQYLQQNPNAILDITGSQNYLSSLGLSTANIGLQRPRVKQIFEQFFQQGAGGQPVLSGMIQQGGTLTDIQSQQLGQQQQQQIASGQLVQIGTSPTGQPLYAPAGSAATQLTSELVNPQNFPELRNIGEPVFTSATSQGNRVTQSFTVKTNQGIKNLQFSYDTTTERNTPEYQQLAQQLRSQNPNIPQSGIDTIYFQQVIKPREVQKAIQSAQGQPGLSFIGLSPETIAQQNAIQAATGGGFPYGATTHTTNHTKFPKSYPNPKESFSKFI